MLLIIFIYTVQVQDCIHLIIIFFFVSDLTSNCQYKNIELMQNHIIKLQQKNIICYLFQC